MYLLGWYFFRYLYLVYFHSQHTAASEEKNQKWKQDTGHLGQSFGSVPNWTGLGLTHDNDVLYICPMLGICTALNLRIRKQTATVTVKTPPPCTAHNSLQWMKTLSVLFSPKGELTYYRGILKESTWPLWITAIIWSYTFMTH